MLSGGGALEVDGVEEGPGVDHWAGRLRGRRHKLSRRGNIITPNHHAAAAATLARAVQQQARSSHSTAGQAKAARQVRLQLPRRRLLLGEERLEPRLERRVPLFEVQRLHLRAQGVRPALLRIWREEVC